MTQNKNDSRPGAPPGPAAEALVGELTNVIVAALGVGAGLAKTVAQATAGDQPVPEPESATSPLRVIVHYGMATVMNVFSVVTKSVNEAGNASSGVRQPFSSAGSKSETPGAATAPAGLPAVHRGSTLRVPLSIENPGSDPMNELHFTCLKLEGGNGEANALTMQAIRLEPKTLSVAPHDFEKLTILVEVPPDGALGRYQARIGLDGGGFNTVLAFDVLPAAK